MSSLHTLTNAEGARTSSFRKGRGRGTGNGKTAGHGQKGQGAHAHTKANGFEGGQTPIARRLPKFGARKTHKGHKTV
jgi:large subunit ribosomal protein L15